MAVIKKIENISKSEWQQLLAYSSTASYFQSPAFYEFFKSLSFLETFGWGIYRNDELNALVCGYLIKNGGSLTSFFSRRAVIHGGLLLADDVSNEEVELLLKELVRNLSKKAIYIEIRNSVNFYAFKDIFQKSGFKFQSHLNYLVDTSIPENIKERYSESKIRQLRKSKSQEVDCNPTTEQKDIDEFYLILKNLYKRKVKKPLFPKEFFEKLVLQENCKLFVVKKDSQVIGGIACAFLPGKVAYEWFVCGDTKNYNYLYPSVVATHTGITFAAENGCQYFDFMGAGKPDVEYGVREFKEKFGGKLHNWGRFIYISNSFLFKIGKFVIETLK